MASTGAQAVDRSRFLGIHDAFFAVRRRPLEGKGAGAYSDTIERQNATPSTEGEPK
jgi:hypothetical protein